MSEIIVCGMRPTGSLHLGHYLGVIKNLLDLQESASPYLFVADWHAMTSVFKDPSIVARSRIEYVKGWIASGIHPNKTVMYNQSSHPEVLYLYQLLLCLTPPGWADRSPSWKDLKVNPKRELDNLGFYTYPVLQAADIAIVNGRKVPVGEDQVSHLEISREIVRKFNRFYKTNLAEPGAMLTKVPKLLGFDGRKMSSSYNNFITLQETEKSLQKKINKMVTDDQRGGIEKPGNPDNCSVFDYHKIFTSAEEVVEVDRACRAAELGCGECKKRLGEVMKVELIPIADRMRATTDDECMDVLRSGDDKVSPIMKENWDNLRNEIGFDRC